MSSDNGSDEMTKEGLASIEHNMGEVDLSDEKQSILQANDPAFWFNGDSNNLFRLLLEADPELSLQSHSQLPGLGLELPADMEQSHNQSHSFLDALNLSTLNQSQHLQSLQQKVTDHVEENPIDGEHTNNTSSKNSSSSESGSIVHRHVKEEMQSNDSNSSSNASFSHITKSKRDSSSSNSTAHTIPANLQLLTASKKANLLKKGPDAAGHEARKVERKRRHKPTPSSSNSSGPTSTPADKSKPTKVPKLKVTSTMMEKQRASQKLEKDRNSMMKKGKLRRKQPTRTDFETDDAFAQAWSEWRNVRERNNAAVQRSRMRAKVKREQDKQALEVREKEFLTLKATIETLQNNVALLIKACKNKEELTQVEAAWIATLSNSETGVQLATQCALFS